MATGRTETLDAIKRIGVLELSAGGIEGMADRLGSLASKTTNSGSAKTRYVLLLKCRIKLKAKCAGRASASIPRAIAL